MVPIKVLRIEDGQRAEATSNIFHVAMHTMPLVPLGCNMGTIVEYVLAIQCLVNDLQNEVGKVRGGRKVVVRDLRIRDVAPHPMQPGTQNAVISDIRTSMYTRVLLENGIPLVHPRGVHCRHHPVQHLQGDGLEEEAAPILVQLGGIRVAHETCHTLPNNHLVPIAKPMKGALQRDAHKCPRSVCKRGNPFNTTLECNRTQCR